MTTEYDQEVESDVLTQALPLRPGSDLSSKILLREESMKDIVISAVVGKGIIGDAYYVSSTEQTDGRRADVIYLPHANISPDLPPVIVEIQQKLHHSFMTRVMRYCLNVFDEMNVLPILVVFNVDGFSSKRFQNTTFKKTENHAFFTHPCELWAQKILIFNGDSIASHVDQIPFEPIVALAYFFTQQQRHLLALDEYDDPTLQKIYRTAYKIFSLDKAIEEDNKLAMVEFCEVSANQFRKIIRCAKKKHTRIQEKVTEVCRRWNAIRREHETTVPGSK